MTRTCFPFVRYTLKIPTPAAEFPRLKNRVCTENLGLSGSSRTANGSSNDSSIPCRVKELSRLNGGLFQSNSMRIQLYLIRPCNVVTMYLHIADYLSTGFFEKNGIFEVKWDHFSGKMASRNQQVESVSGRPSLCHPLCLSLCLREFEFRG